MKTTALLTIHNKESLAQEVCFSLASNLSELNDQIIVVFDGCTDNSEFIVKNILNKINNKKIDYVYTNDVFETKANNAGLKIVQNEFVVLLQDDMIVREKNFDKRMLQPLLEFNDVFAVTSFVAHNNIYNETTKEINYIDVAKNTESDRNTFYVREYANRGPLMFNYRDVVKLNYLDEDFAPNAYDDMDICMRAVKQLNKVSGLYWIDYISNPNWGTSRQKNQSLHINQYKKNALKILEKHKDLLYSSKKIVENRKLTYEN